MSAILLILFGTCTSTISLVATKTIVYLTLSQKLGAAIYHIQNGQCEGDGEINGTHLSKELEIFEAAGEGNRNIKLLFNSLKTIPQTSIESERAEHD